MTLDEMKNVDIRTVDPAALIEIQGVVINTDLPQIERMKDYQRQVGNPYCFMYEGVAVKVSFTDTTVSVNERMENYLRTL